MKIEFWTAVLTLALPLWAVPMSGVLEETFVDVVELPSVKREEGGRKYKLWAFDKEIDLELQKTEGLLPTNLPVFVYGEDEQGNPTVDDWTHRTDSFQQLYSDMSRGASIMVEDIEGQTKLSGSLGDGLIIEPVRDITLPPTADNDFSEVPESSRLRHVVYRVADTPQPKAVPRLDTREKRAILPEKLYVPVQVVVDYGLWMKMAKTEDEVIKYVKQFYNSVNQLYAPLAWPSVAISIYGITICKTSSACNMIESIKVDSQSVDATKVLFNVATYAYQQKSATGTDYAILMLMTDYDLCVPQSDGSCQEAAVSASPVGGACARFRNGQTAKIGVFEDHGVFHGVKIAVNSIGRLLGMLADGDTVDASETPQIAGSPGAESCSYTDGYIMGQTVSTKTNPNNFIWSQCSIDQLRWFSKQPQAACLHVVPTPGKHGLISKPPGSDIGLDNQCKVLFGPTSKLQCRLPGFNKGNDELCQGLACSISPTACRSQGPPADGSYCGPQRHCLQGKCVCNPNAPLPTAVPKDPSCQGDHTWLLINGKTCEELLSEADALTRYCNAEPIRDNCCESVSKYCKADPITCDGQAVVTQKPTPPDQIFTIAPTTTKRPYTEPTDIACGKSCIDNKQVKIDSKDCSTLL
ncbi:A disintegrin and metalloproteinase with thrombospondin motifs like [Watersipora subatra]|uniref:A disintegrin and metalloproteinase with thrombospondin motifs like n=1 Tax=Watersipora subatra TaxID=2589382 RepID=UPI00355AD601